MELIPVNNKYFDKPNINEFVEIVYINFADLCDYTKLGHTRQEIKRLLLDNNMSGFVLLDNKTMVGYLLGEFKVLPDRRKIYFINYVYIGKKYRKNGYGSKIIDVAISLAHKKYQDAVVLICDTQNDFLFDFYQRKGFMLDLNLRRFDRHDVLSITL